MRQTDFRLLLENTATPPVPSSLPGDPDPVVSARKRLHEKKGQRWTLPPSRDHWDSTVPTPT